MNGTPVLEVPVGLIGEIDCRHALCSTPVDKYYDDLQSLSNPDPG